MLTPLTTALISSRKSVRNRKGSGESFATRAISPVIRIWHAIMRPFSSSILHPRLLATSRAIRWVLLIVAIAALGYLGWQRFQGGDHQARAEAQKPVLARAAVPVR